MSAEPRTIGHNADGAGAARLARLPAELLQRAGWRVGLGAGRRLRHGRLDVVLPDGSRQRFGQSEAQPRAELQVHDARAFQRILLGGATGAGEAYMDGLWSSPDLVALLSLGAINRDAVAISAGWWRLPAQAGRTLAHRARRNTPSGAKRNIARHYDLGNEFYRLFLDETMTYSSAVFASPEQSLADAQRNKYRLLAERAGLQAGQHVLEIGCGWGGFALYAAGELGCRVTAITISAEQHRLASERVREAGLQDRVEIQLRDYRDVCGRYDAIVSIEMLEAVGAEYFSTFFQACDRVLAPGGRLSVQVITLPEADYEGHRRGANWIQTYIFPGGLCPSLAALEEAIGGTGLLVTDVEDIAPHYVRTLRAWRTRFLEQAEAVRAMGFDDLFVRMWEYYLALSEASFATGMSQDLQILFEKRRVAA
ncbi:MAG TPA: cyclopropane-fatty-acyl-phospholipid synthase family protein [Candidatus Limnocylindria bacterium]|nr:cyclopropane-fatty-acyl-phospholipid synthase family protein [Candidatus Limnocylindria bacterium]